MKKKTVIQRSFICIRSNKILKKWMTSFCSLTLGYGHSLDLWPSVNPEGQKILLSMMEFFEQVTLHMYLYKQPLPKYNIWYVDKTILFLESRTSVLQAVQGWSDKSSWFLFTFSNLCIVTRTLHMYVFFSLLKIIVNSWFYTGEVS